MKPVLIFILYLSVSNFQLLAQNSGIDFFHGSFEEAKEKAAKEGKLIFMDAYASWCGPCKMMASKVFPLQEVGAFFNENFINLKIDMEKGEGRTLKSIYKVSAYPTLFILDEKGEVLKTVRGAMREDRLIKWAKTVKNVPSESVFEELQTKFDDGDHSNELLVKLIPVKKALNKPYTKEIHTLYNQLDESSWENQKIINVILEYTEDVNSKGMQYVFKHKHSISKEKGIEVFDKYIYQLGYKFADKYIEEEDESNFKSVLKFMKLHKPKGYTQFSDAMKLKWMEEQKDWKGFNKGVWKYLDLYESDADKAYRDAAWTYYMNIDNMKYLENANKQIQKRIQKNSTYDNNLTQAYLLYKMDRYSEAEDAVNYAIILGEGKNTDNAKGLRSKILKKLNKPEIVE